MREVTGGHILVFPKLYIQASPCRCTLAVEQQNGKIKRNKMVLKRDCYLYFHLKI